MRIGARVLVALWVVAVLAATTACVPVPVPVPVPWSPFGAFGDVPFGMSLLPGLGSFDTSESGEPAVPEGPLLKEVAKLPVDAQGVGTLVGVAPGEAAYDGSDAGDPQNGWFALVLRPTPQGLPARTRVDVYLDPSTDLYVDGTLKGKALKLINGDNSNYDPSYSSSSLTVRFKVRSDRVYAESVNLPSPDNPPF